MEIKTEIINGKRYVCIDDLEKLFETKPEFKLSAIIKDIIDSYGSLRNFSKISGISTGHISYLQNDKREEPKPEMLRKIADNSKGITTYKELIQVCGYLDGIEE